MAMGGAGGVEAARDWAARELSLPIFPEMAEGEIEAVIDAVMSSISVELRNR